MQFGKCGYKKEFQHIVLIPVLGVQFLSCVVQHMAAVFTLVSTVWLVVQYSWLLLCGAAYGGCFYHGINSLVGGTTYIPKAPWMSCRPSAWHSSELFLLNKSQFWIIPVVLLRSKDRVIPCANLISFGLGALVSRCVCLVVFAIYSCVPLYLFLIRFISRADFF